MEKFVKWLNKSLTKAQAIHDRMEAIPFEERTVKDNNQMISNGGKVTILKGTLDYIKTHKGLTKF